MAAIGSIRKYSGFLIGAIGVSLVGFLVMDFTNSQGSVLKGRKDTVGKVYGDKIGILDFNKKYDENLKGAEEQMRGQALNDDQRNGIRTQTWNEMVNKIIFDRVYDKLGINVTPEEMSELATGTENASPSITQVPGFQNPQTRQFDPQQVRLFLSRLDVDDEGAEPGSKRRMWMRFETSLKQNQYQQKYSNLITKGLYVPNWMAEMTYNNSKRLADFKYVVLPYTEVSDSAVKVSDDDIKKYIDAHAARFKQEEETRKFQYVTFDIAPSAGDTAHVIASLEEKREEFAKGENPSADSLFVKLYSETPFDEVYYDKEKLYSSVKDSFFSLPVKSVVGPYIEGKNAKLAKISDRKMISDSLHLREIVISFAGLTQNDQEKANAKFRLVDSLVREIDTLKGNFNMLAMMHSDDTRSKMAGGDIGWVKQGEREKYYNDLMFYRAKKGVTYKIPVQSENAIHLVQIVEDRPSKTAVQVAYFTKEILPSPETERNIYGTANNFVIENQGEKKFVDAARRMGVKTVNAVKKDEYQVQYLGNARELIKWVFNAKKGDVSSIFTVDKKHVVVMLEDIHPAGLPEVSAVKEQLRPEVAREKKFELLAKKISDAKAVSIEELASKLGKAPMDAHVSFEQSGLVNAYEPKVIGAAFGVAKGKVSAPIQGNDGVYAIQVVNVEEPAKTTDYSEILPRLNRTMQQKSSYASEVQKKLAKVQDNRFDFF